MSNLIKSIKAHGRTSSVITLVWAAETAFRYKYRDLDPGLSFSRIKVSICGPEVKLYALAAVPVHFHIDRWHVFQRLPIPEQEMGSVKTVDAEKVVTAYLTETIDSVTLELINRIKEK